MSLLSARELLQLIDDGVIENSGREFVNAASIDVRLGDTFLFEDNDSERNLVDLSKREAPQMKKTSLRGDAYAVLLPGSFCLAHTMEKFNLPDHISGMFILKSSMARAGLEHSQAGLADPGWHGSVLTLELCNLLRKHTLILRPGMRIGQMVFFRHEPVTEEFSYRTKGNYNGDVSVQVTRAAK